MGVRGASKTDEFEQLGACAANIGCATNGGCVYNNCFLYFILFSIVWSYIVVFYSKGRGWGWAGVPRGRPSTIGSLFLITVYVDGVSDRLGNPGSASNDTAIEDVPAFYDRQGKERPLGMGNLAMKYSKAVHLKGKNSRYLRIRH